uniref:CD94-1/NKR-P1-related receptor n=1 Tax=Botryllus schlosseri TaxID=30301 RepID=Q869B4_BOTSH|nr:CD94-1/NKR-P1-related receptor [Botryllus schlosseri]
MNFHKVIALVLVTYVLAGVNGVKPGEKDKRMLDEENSKSSRIVREDPKWMKLCDCAKPAMRKMHDVIAEYTGSTKGSLKRRREQKPPALDEVIAKIKEIAHDCTKQQRCRCPKGFIKRKSDHQCLKISNKAVSCQEAVEACSADGNARLAVAKDDDKLTALADYIKEIDPTDNSFYWIGLSYNRTEEGRAKWTWEDGSAASYEITKDLKTSVKKTLDLTILHPGDVPTAIERVAISKNYKGSHWKPETCSEQGRKVKHKYICEFLMFKVQIKAVSTKTKSPVPHKSAAKVSGKVKNY